MTTTNHITNNSCIPFFLRYFLTATNTTKVDRNTNNSLCFELLHDSHSYTRFPHLTAIEHITKLTRFDGFIEFSVSFSLNISGIISQQTATDMIFDRRNCIDNWNCGKVHGFSSPQLRLTAAFFLRPFAYGRSDKRSLKYCRYNSKRGATSLS